MVSYMVLLPTGGPASNPGATVGLGSFFEFNPLTNSLTVIESIDDKSEIGHSIHQQSFISK
jgi:hypothetical protein